MQGQPAPPSKQALQRPARTRVSPAATHVFPAACRSPELGDLWRLCLLKLHTHLAQAWRELKEDAQRGLLPHVSLPHGLWPV